jgi:hypothetical protein
MTPERADLTPAMRNGYVTNVVDLSGLRHTVEEINDAGLQRILGAHDEEPFSLN